jgi:hypothetical protein
VSKQRHEREVAALRGQFELETVAAKVFPDFYLSA